MKKAKQWIVDLPDCHPSLNVWTRMHFRVRNQLKKDWAEMVYYACLEAKLPKISEPVEVFIIYYHPRKTVDLDNYTPKFIMDPLKNFIVDDNIQWVKKLGWEFQRGAKRSRVFVKTIVD